MILVNGFSNATVSALDRGLTLGDGLFTTLHLKKQTPVLWSYHTQRIANGCEKLKLPVPDFDSLYEQCCELAAAVADDNVCGKIIVTRGCGGVATAL